MNEKKTLTERADTLTEAFKSGDHEKINDALISVLDGITRDYAVAHGWPHPGISEGPAGGG